MFRFTHKLRGEGTQVEQYNCSLAILKIYQYLKFPLNNSSCGFLLTGFRVEMQKVSRCQ